MKYLLALIFISFLNLSKTQSFINAFQLGSIGSDDISKVITDSESNIVIAGFYDNSEIDMDPSDSKYTIKTNGGRDAFLAKYDKNNKLVWAKSIGGYDVDWIYNICLDKDDNIYACGKYTDQALFTENGKKYDVIGSSDGFAAKYDKNGTLIWVKTIGSSAYEIINDIAVDKDKNVYLAGYTNGEADLDPGAGKVFYPVKKYADSYLIKLDESGNYKWSVPIGSDSAPDEASALAIGSDNNIIVFGYFSGTIDIDPSSSIKTLNSLSKNEDVYYCKYNSVDGSLIFGNSISCSGGMSVLGVTKNLINNNISFYGGFRSDIYIGSKIETSKGISDAYLVTINENGQIANYISFGGSQFDIITAAVYDQNQNLFITGNIQSTNVDIQPGSGSKIVSTSAFGDIFLIKYDKSNSVINSLLIGGPGYDGGSSLSIDKLDRVILGATFEKSVKFDVASNTEFSSHGSYDLAVLKFNKNSVASKDLSDDFLINTFPNPSFNELNLNFISDNFNNVNWLKVIDSRGNLIEVHNTIEKFFNLNTSHYLPGVYYLELFSNEGNKKTIKFIIGKK